MCTLNLNLKVLTQGRETYHKINFLYKKFDGNFSKTRFRGCFGGLISNSGFQVQTNYNKLIMEPGLRLGHEGESLEMKVSRSQFIILRKCRISLCVVYFWMFTTLTLMFSIEIYKYISNGHS